jgi:hypothetical protein
MTYRCHVRLWREDAVIYRTSLTNEERALTFGLRDKLNNFTHFALLLNDDCNAIGRVMSGCHFEVLQAFMMQKGSS